MGKYDVAVTDLEGKKIVNQIFGQLDAQFLSQPNPSKNKTYFKAIKQILEQIQPEQVEITV